MKFGQIYQIMTVLYNNYYYILKSVPITVLIIIHVLIHLIIAILCLWNHYYVPFIDDKIKA